MNRISRESVINCITVGSIFAAAGSTMLALSDAATFNRETMEMGVGSPDDYMIFSGAAILIGLSASLLKKRDTDTQDEKSDEYGSLFEENQTPSKLWSDDPSFYQEPDPRNQF